VVSATDPYGRILGFLDRSFYIFFQVAPQLYSQGRVNPVPDPLLLRKSGSAWNRTRTSGSVAKNSDHYTTEAVVYRIINLPVVLYGCITCSLMLSKKSQTEGVEENIWTEEE
jgi:hypothetical protein